MADSEMSQELPDRFGPRVSGLEDVVKLVHVVDVELHPGDARALELHHVLSQSSGFVRKDVFDLAKFLEKKKTIFNQNFFGILISVR